MLMYIVFIVIMFFFFKQKTAYEMRISDWSSDLCSSDLLGRDVLREVQVIARVRIHGVGRDDAGLAVIAVLEAFDAIRIVDEHRVRPIRPDGDRKRVV